MTPRPTPRPLLRVGLTGGIATGKSHCLGWFASQGIPVIDSDRIARQAIGPGTDGLAAVIRRFGPSIVGSYGLVDRAALGRIVFADPAARRDLEAIVHPFVFRTLAGWFDSLALPANAPAGGPAPPIAIADVPLLYETERADLFHCVVVAACTPGQQLERLMARDRLTEPDARLRIDAQWPIDEKRRRADYVIDTGGTPAETEARCAEVLAALNERIS
jgi:dephospho-CoA kinase